MNLDVVKGILILLVILDHNEFSRSVFPRFFDGFGFHVVGFLAIPFLKPAPALDRNFANHAFRLYYPFFVIVTVAALAVTLTTSVAGPTQLRMWALALYSGNADVLKQATNMALLWFLPSFIALLTLRAVIERTKPRAKAGLFVLACVAHLFIGAVAQRIQDYLPLGLLPALYVIPLAYLIVVAHRSLLARLPAAHAVALAATVFIVVKWLQVRAHLFNEVGFSDVADYRNPLALLLNDLESITGVLMVFQLARLRLGRFIEACGRHSMQVYLCHAFVALAVYKAAVYAAPGAGTFVLFAVSMLATAVASLAVARWLAENRLSRRFVFPRDPQALFGAGRASMQPASRSALPPAPSNPDVFR